MPHTLSTPLPLLERFDLDALSQAIRSDLTPRQRCILAWVADAATNGAIAEELGINVKTVEADLRKIFDVLGVDNRIHAALIWVLASDPNLDSKIRHRR